MRHCAKLYTLCGKQESNVFYHLSKEQYKEVRKNCIESILHTDMMAHQAMVKDLQILFQINTDIFTVEPECSLAQKLSDDLRFFKGDEKGQLVISQPEACL